MADLLWFSAKKTTGSKTDARPVRAPPLGSRFPLIGRGELMGSKDPAALDRVWEILLS
jgi:hypothetical protein